MQYYSDDHGGLHGVTIVGRGGSTPDTVAERVYAIADLKRMRPVSDVPDEWLVAIGYEQPEPEPEPEPYYDRQVIDITWWPFAGSSPPAPPETADQKFWREIGTLIVVVLFVLYLIF